MKVQIQRVGRSEHYNPHQIDDKPVNAILVNGIELGESLFVRLANIDDGSWHTTKVVQIEQHEDGIIFVHTKNSIYRIEKGWKE